MRGEYNFCHKSGVSNWTYNRYGYGTAWYTFPRMSSCSSGLDFRSLMPSIFFLGMWRASQIWITWKSTTEVESPPLVSSSLLRYHLQVCYIVLSRLGMRGSWTILCTTAAPAVNCMAVGKATTWFSTFALSLNSFLFLIRVIAVFHDARPIQVTFAFLWLAVVAGAFVQPFCADFAATGISVGCIATVVKPYCTSGIVIVMVHDTLVLLVISSKLLVYSLAGSWSDRFKVFFSGRGMPHISRLLMQTGQLNYMWVLILFRRFNIFMSSCSKGNSSGEYLHGSCDFHTICVTDLPLHDCLIKSHGMQSYGLPCLPKGQTRSDHRWHDNVVLGFSLRICSAKVRLTSFDGAHNFVFGWSIKLMRWRLTTSGTGIQMWREDEHTVLRDHEVE